jgi:hypothetical protein
MGAAAIPEANVQPKPHRTTRVTCRYWPRFVRDEILAISACPSAKTRLNCSASLGAALSVETACRAAQPARKTFAIGFQTGHEMNWLPRAMHLLRDELQWRQ